MDVGRRVVVGVMPGGVAGVQATDTRHSKKIGMTLLKYLIELCTIPS